MPLQQRRQAMGLLLQVLFVVVAVLLLLEPAHGGDLATLTLTPFGNERNVSYRQDFCERSNNVLNNKNTNINNNNNNNNNITLLKDALRGAQLHPVLQYGAAFPYFRYDPVTGIDADYPGVVARLLDIMAERGGFTWRQSFGVYTNDDKGDNRTWTEMLEWATDTYDLSIDKWAQSTERLNMGIAFCDPWFDGSLIMIDKIEPPLRENKVNYGNWLLPFDNKVWYVVIATILASALVYQAIQILGGECVDDSPAAGLVENLYLSTINFTQNYTYEPRSLAGRVFGISFAFWTMLIGATYTANLASLLVERPVQALRLANMDDAIDRDYSVCTHSQSFSDIFVQNNYGRRVGAVIQPQPTPFDMYLAVERDECDVLIGTKQAWDSFKNLREYNPACQLEWVGRTVHYVDAAFTTKVDSGVQCTGLVNDVINFFLSQLKDEGILQEVWDEYNLFVQEDDFTCNLGSRDDRRRRRQLQPSASHNNDDEHHNYNYNNNYNADHRHGRRRQRRELKGGSSGGAAGGGAATAAAALGEDGGGEEEALSLKQMAGTFLLHAIGSILALAIAVVSYFQSPRESAVASKTVTIEDSSAPVESQLEALRTTQFELQNHMAMILHRLNAIQHKLDVNDGTTNTTITATTSHSHMTPTAVCRTDSFQSTSSFQSAAQSSFASATQEQPRKTVGFKFFD